jgi:Flp pilus assembly pilin Flp
MLRRIARVLRAEVGQTTAEYALVILGAAAIGALLIAWATKSHAVGKLFDEVIEKVLP